MCTRFKAIGSLEARNSFLLTPTSPSFNVLSLMFILYKKIKLLFFFFFTARYFFWYSFSLLFHLLSCFDICFFHILFLLLFLLLTSFYIYYLHFLSKHFYAKYNIHQRFLYHYHYDICLLLFAIILVYSKNNNSFLYEQKKKNHSKSFSTNS